LAIASDSSAPCIAASNMCSILLDLGGQTLERRRDGANLLSGQRSFAKPHGERARQSPPLMSVYSLLMPTGVPTT
jgi:hypothetical protein